MKLRVLIVISIVISSVARDPSSCFSAGPGAIGRGASFCFPEDSVSGIPPFVKGRLGGIFLSYLIRNNRKITSRNRFMKRSLFSLIATALKLVSLVALSANSFGAESGKGTPLRLAYSAITVNQAIPWIAHDAGHFKKHGLDVELVHASSTLALQALLAGEVSVAQSVTDACVSSNLNGADTLFMGAILDRPLYSFIVNPKIKSPQDLKGKRVGVTRIGSTPDALARAMLENVEPRSRDRRDHCAIERNGTFGSRFGEWRN